MSKDSNNWALTVSQKIYGRLLLAYPKTHRAEYGPAMAQLFKDQCRDAWNEASGFGVMKLWLRVLPDLVNTSIGERLSALNQRKSMFDKMTMLTQPRTAFLKVFVLVFLLILCTTVVVTFLLPETYASTSQVKVESDEPEHGSSSDPYFIQTTFEIMESQLVLEPVIEKLNLNTIWDKKYGHNEPLKTENALEMLRSRITLTPVRNTSLVGITVYSDDKNEAAQIANAIAKSYQDYRVKYHATLTAKSLDVLQQEYQREEAQIRQVQSEADSLRQKFNIPDIEASSPTEFAQHFSKERVEGEQAYRKQLVQLTQLQQLSQNQLREILPAISPDKALNGLLDKLHENERQYTSLTNDYPLSNPQVAQTQSLNDMLNRQINVRIAGIMVFLEAQANAKRSALNSIIAIVETATAAKPYWDEKQELAKQLEFHKLLAARIDSEKIDQQIPNASMAEIITTAKPGSVPVRPNKPLNITLGAICGILLALIVGGIAALITFLIRKRIRRNPATA